MRDTAALLAGLPHGVPAAALGFLDPSTILSAVGVAGMAAVLFAETGLLVGFFLPGDSLLFTAGIFAARAHPFAPLWLLLVVAAVAAVAGDQVGYLIGDKAGPRVFSGRQSRVFKPEYVERSQAFFDRYGSRTVLLARLVPVVRTFVPVIAGVSRMRYRTFVAYNVVGGVVWSAGVLVLGYLLGGISFVRDNLEVILLAIVVVSVVPVAVELLRARRAGTGRPTPAARRGSAARRAPVAAKVPEITALFWLVKVLTTGMGEAASDYLGELNLVLAGVVGVGGLVLALWLQFRTRRYVAVVYWSAVGMVAVSGTIAADVLHVVGHVPYAGSTAVYAVLLALVFWRWHRSEGTLSIHSIVTRRREAYYWLTVGVTFALGTAAGDLTAAELGLGYLTSGIVFAVLIAVPLVGWWRFRMPAVGAFWAAYVLTRPLGASFADWFGKPADISGLGFGDGPVTLVLLAAIAVVVAYLAVARPDIQREVVLDPAGRGSGTRGRAGAVATGHDDTGGGERVRRSGGPGGAGHRGR